MAELVEVLSDISGWLCAIFWVLVAIEFILIVKNIGGGN